MKLKSTFTLAILCILFCVNACSTKIKPTINVPVVGVAPDIKRRADIRDVTVFLEEFVDSRTSTELVRMEGKVSQPEGSIGYAATGALRQALTRVGFAIDDSAPLIISGEVREWSADIEGDMPSRIESKAALYIEVFDPANKRIYSGTYNGQAMLQETAVDEPEIARTLSEALSESVSQMLRDDRLMSLLASF